MREKNSIRRILMSNDCHQVCGLFDFMANEVGIKVLHPGGYKATGELGSLCQLNEDSHVLDLACGTGTTSFFLHRKYRCRVTGIDIADNLIAMANEDLARKKKSDSITFEVGDALCLPYPDNTFDGVVAQAFFVLIDEKEKALSEILRVLKPGGYFGSLELSWFSPPPPEVFDELAAKTCNDFIPRVCTFEDWEGFFDSTGLIHQQTLRYPMTSGMMKMVHTEGFWNFLKIMKRMMTHSSIRKRMMTVQNTFGKYDEYLGYGIYCFQK